MNDRERFSVPELLGIERETALRVAHRTEQWGRALENTLPPDRSQRDDARLVESTRRIRREIASLFTTAGSYRLSVEPQGAAEDLRAAAAHFEAVGSPYAHAVAVCGGDIQSSWMHELDRADRPLTASERELVLLRLAWLGASGFSIARRALLMHLDAATVDTAEEVGRLRVPLGSVLRVLEAVARMLEDDSPQALDRMSASVHDYLMRCHDITAQAMSDRFHWRNLMSSVLPVEPEAAALGAVVMAILVRRDLADELMTRLDLPAPALAPLLTGLSVAQMRG